MRRSLLLAALLALGCTAEQAPHGVEGGGGAGGASAIGCAPGTRELDDGRCLAAGLPESGCASGEMADDEGRCVAAGLGPEDCGRGFVHDGDAGCDAVLPASPCPAGRWAVPGDTSCRDFSQCDPVHWPAGPISERVLYVAAIPTGPAAPQPADGSRDRPFRAIQEAVDAAPSGALIAVDEGSYREPISVQGKQIAIWGRCASMVRLESTGSAAITLGPGAAGSLVRGLEITGTGHAIVVSDAEEVELRDLWLHDLTGHGVHLERVALPTSATLRASLIERATGRGSYALASHLTLDTVAIRDMQLNDADMGRCVDTDQHPETDEPARLDLRRIFVERCREVGVMVHASSATIDESLIRDTLPRTDGRGGRALLVQTNVDGQPGQVTVTATNIEGAHDSGVSFMSGGGLLDRVVVRDVEPNEYQSIRGYGIGADALRYAPTEVVVRRSLVERASEAGVFNAGASVDLESVLVRDTRPVTPDVSGLPSILGGRGLVVQSEPAVSADGSSVVRASVFRDNSEVGVNVAGGSLVMEDSVIEGTMPVASQHGRGVAIQPDANDGSPANVIVRSTIIARNQEVGISVDGSDAIFEGVRVEQTAPLESGLFGIGFLTQQGQDNGHVSRVEIRDSVSSADRTAGIMVTVGDLLVAHSVVEGTRPGSPSLPFGDGIVGLALGVPPAIAIHDSAISAVSRAGIANFGGLVEIRGATIDCAAMSLVADPYGGFAPQTTDGGGNVCGCELADELCMVLSASLEPPEPPSAL